MKSRKIDWLSVKSVGKGGEIYEGKDLRKRNGNIIHYMIVRPVGDALEIVAEVRASEVANSDAVVDVKTGGEVVAAALDETEDMELIGSWQQPLYVVSRHVRLTRVRVVDDQTHHV